jgi:hypothetical protein
MLASPRPGTARVISPPCSGPPPVRKTRLVTCVECGTVADERAAGWRAYRSDLPPETDAEDTSTADVPTVVVFCESCAAGEFGDGSSDW